MFIGNSRDTQLLSTLRITARIYSRVLEFCESESWSQMLIILNLDDYFMPRSRIPRTDLRAVPRRPWILKQLGFTFAPLLRLCGLCLSGYFLQLGFFRAYCYIGFVNSTANSMRTQLHVEIGENLAASVMPLGLQLTSFTPFFF